MSELALKLIAENRKTRDKRLDLGKTGLRSIPPVVLDCTWLEVLIISNEWWQYSEVDEVWVKRKSLNRGRYNKLSFLPSFLGKLKNLKVLIVSGQPDRRWQLQNLTPLEGLKNLEVLNCSFSMVRNLSPLNSSWYLRQLLVGYTNVKNLRPISNLGGLRIADFELTKIRDLKPLSRLLNLRALYLGNNSIIDIDPLKGLVGLRDLGLSSTEIFDLNPLQDLTELRRLSCSKTDVFDLNPLGQMTKLHFADFASTNIADLSPLLPLIKNGLKITSQSVCSDDEASFFRSPLSSPPIEIVQQGNEAILEYFRQKEVSGAEVLNEAKLILLGDGRSGKTSLANRLLGKELPKQEDRTEGVDINIGEYQFQIANDQIFKLHIWDFAGQDKYKPLHQLFYTESSLYVMVAESGNTGTDFDDWLQTAELFGEGSPLIVVLNEFKDGIGMGTFDQNHWKRQFPNLLKDVYTTNLLTQKGMPEIEKDIQLLTQLLPHLKYSFPKNWAAIRRELESRREEQVISLDEYFKICQNNNLPEEDSALILSSVLHKIGVCLHYQKSDLLKQFLILKNEWATDAVYKILEDREVGEHKCGFFNRQDLERIWSDENYRHMRPQLLELMQQFKMAYPLPGRQEFITPPLLPPARPDRWHWGKEDALELYIEYEFLPKVLMTQFIVSRHFDIDEGRTLVWRNGVVLRWDDEALAEVTKTKLQGRDAIYIRSQGSNRKGLMTVILKTFRDLHSEYKGLKCEEKVPCKCDGCVTKKNKQHYFDLANLQLRLERGRRVVECDKSLEELNLLTMLENQFVFRNIQIGRPLAFKEKIGYSERGKTKIFKIFLASSNELKSERERIEVEIGRKNKDLRKGGIFIDLLIWEDNRQVGASFRSQDHYNLDVVACDFFILLFYSKLGKYTLEEYEGAKTRFDESGKPRILICQKDMDLPKGLSREDADSRFDFIESLREVQHFPVLFSNKDGAIKIIGDAIDRLVADSEFMSQLLQE